MLNQAKWSEFIVVVVVGLVVDVEVEVEVIWSSLVDEKFFYQA